MCWTRIIPLNLSSMCKTKAETVYVCHHACLLWCLLDHLILNIWTLFTRSDVIWALVLGAGCERGSAILRKAKTERGFHLFGIFSLFPQLGGCARELKYGTKALSWEFGGPTRRGLNSLTLQITVQGRNTQIKVRIIGSTGTFWVLFSMDVHRFCCL